MRQVKNLLHFYRVSLGRVSDGHSTGELNNQLQTSLLTHKNIVRGGQVISLESLRKELDLLEKLDETAQTNTFFHLLQKYSWRVGDPEKQDDHHDLAVPFCDSFRIEKALEKHESFILVKGDLSGIQKYIYGKSSQNAPAA